MSIRPMDLQSVYLRMGEVSREQDKEVKKEDRQQSFHKGVQRFREDAFSVHRSMETHADQVVKEHEERGLPPRRDTTKHDCSADAESTDPEESPLYADTKQHAKSLRETLDPDLGYHVNIEG